VNKQHVDVAGLVPIAARSRAENARIQRLGPPARQFVAEAPPQFVPQPRKRVSHTRTNVITVEFMHLVAAHQRGTDDSLLNQPRKTASDADFRATCCLLGNLAHRKRLARRGQNGENCAVQRRCDSTCRIG
jgi:hypothetical protein